jgi:glucose/arabinose dehydrogenase
MTGLIRPIDVAAAPDGSLTVADFIYGNLWRAEYIGG